MEDVLTAPLYVLVVLSAFTLGIVGVVIFLIIRGVLLFFSRVTRRAVRTATAVTARKTPTNRGLLSGVLDP